MSYNENPQFTSLSSITLIILKELRLERNYHQAHLAEICDKTPSAWTKIETGKSPLTLEIFFRVCTGLSVPPSAVLAAAERYAGLLRQYSWGVMSKQLSYSDDCFLKGAQDYYSSLGFRSRVNNNVNYGAFNPVLSGPIYNQDNTIIMSDVFRYVLSSDFKDEQNTPPMLYNQS